MHHELLVLVVISFGHQVGDHVGVLGQKGLVVDLLPFEPLAKLGAGFVAFGGWNSDSREPKILKVQVSNKIQLSV